MIQLLAAYLAKAVLILALTAAIAGLASRGSAAVRHAIWTAGLAASLFVLPVSMAIPGVHLGLAEAGAAGVAANVVVLLWLATAAVLTIRIARDQIALQRIAARAEAVTNAEVLALSRQAAAAMGVRRVVRLRRWSGSMPATYGTLRPTILLPEASAAWPPERIRLVLLHEMGHIARLDTAAYMLARIVQAVHWFNPLSWHGIRRIRSDCEESCDDRVLNAGAEPLAYARTLLETVRDCSRSPPRGALAMTAAECLKKRLERICSPDRPKRVPKSLAAFIALAIGAAAMMLAPLRFETPVYGDYGAEAD
jgi:beta-lactamase regulating signal transducer with metallopeptidase domain